MFKDTCSSLDEPPHPGEILREDILPCLDVTPRDLAKHLAIKESDLAEFLNEARPVTLELAQRLAAALGQAPHYWLGLQLQFDMFQAAFKVPDGVKPVTWRKKRAVTTVPSHVRTPGRAGSSQPHAVKQSRRGKAA